MVKKMNPHKEKIQGLKIEERNNSLSKTGINVIGDIAGRYGELKLLLDKMPKTLICSLGDIVDRGSQSKECVEFLMRKEKEENAIILGGNHELMLLDAYEATGHQYSPGTWQYNGGRATLDSFGGNIPKEVLAWIKTLKKSITFEIDNKTFYISHAFKTKWDSENDPTIFYWNRRQPEVECFGGNIPDVQIAGHNSNFGLRYWNFPNKKQAICIDTSASAVLTGIHLPSMNIYQQKYL